MKEFIDKLIERLEEERKLAYEVKEKCARGKMLMFDNAKGYFTGISNAISIVNQLAEEYKGGWIPCERELPKEDERILCLHSDGFIDCGVLLGETWCCDMDEYSVIRDDVHAWQPLPALPAPYTEGE